MKKQNFAQSHAYLIIGDFDIDQVKTELEIAPGDERILLGESASIEDLRELMRWLSLKPLTSGVKLIVIQDFDKIATESANTILKTLEEPPDYAKIILTTRNENKILPTIQSRCQKVRISTNPHVVNDEDYVPPNEIHEFTIKEKFDLASNLANMDISRLEDVLTTWQIYFRDKLLSGENALNELNEISHAKGLLGTNISVKLLLENLVLKI